MIVCRQPNSAQYGEKGVEDRAGAVPHKEVSTVAARDHVLAVGPPVVDTFHSGLISARADTTASGSKPCESGALRMGRVMYLCPRNLRMNPRFFSGDAEPPSPAEPSHGSIKQELPLSPESLPSLPADDAPPPSLSQSCASLAALPSSLVPS
jgi:hypothetical protein